MARSGGAHPRRVSGLTLLRRNVMNASTLPQSEANEYEVNKLHLSRHTVNAAQQTISFLDLPAEIRNEIYQLVLAPEDGTKDLIVATPYKDDLMASAVQPALTRISRQVRTEALDVFYGNHKLVAYIERFDFYAFTTWAQCVTSGPRPSKLHVHVKLLDQMKCESPLLDLAESWRDLPHQNLHVWVHDCFPSPIEMRGFDQRRVVVKTLGMAERLREGANSFRAELELAFFEMIIDEVPPSLLCSCSVRKCDRCSLIDWDGMRRAAGWPEWMLYNNKLEHSSPLRWVQRR